MTTFAAKYRQQLDVNVHLKNLLHFYQLTKSTMVNECELRAYLKGGAYFSIGFCFPYILLSAYVKKSNPRAFRYLLVVPVMTALHTLTYIPKDLEKCRAQQQQNQASQQI